ncbi:DUF4931 domain-containing protein [Peribacillus kribbensis]|uniref:DUF4931 domain-containing protein n=1 Tax=Peribacillus kribbensis TaxID=356658 RepID=UPI00040C915A|nr:DUF4931 domain-containing protein [Peribacillus kribbensis]
MSKENDLIYFQNNIGAGKPNSMVNRSTACPFCERESLTDILDEKGSILYLMNKYPTLKDTFQTLIIETDNCEEDISTYSFEHLKTLLEFGVSKWNEMRESGLYKSVIFYKNHGPLSGGTIHHPHMQIVGLKDADYQQKLSPKYFEGIPAGRKNHVELNISEHPIMGFTEFNVIMKEGGDLSIFARYLQSAVHFVLNHFHRSCTSYNLFFYHYQGKVICKIIPRFVVSPLFVGYSFSQVSNNLVDTKLRIQEMYGLDIN